MSASSRQTRFNTDWSKDPKFSVWVGKDPNSNQRARCVLCGVNFEIENMGDRALNSHAQKHMKKVQFTRKVKEEVKPLSAFWTSSSSDLDGNQTTAEEQEAGTDVLIWLYHHHRNNQRSKRRRSQPV